MDRPHEIHPRIEVELTVRSGCKNDIEVCEECVYGDGYHLQRLKAIGFDPKTIVDVGANIGAFSAFAHKLWPTADILCIEPHPSSYELLTINCPFAQCVEGAIGHSELFCKGDLYGGTSGWFDKPIDAEVLHVRRLFLDDWTLRMTQVDLLKLDCEGAEYGLLGTSKRTTSITKAIIGEYHATTDTWNGFYQIREAIQQQCPLLTVVTDEDRDPTSSLGSKIGPFTALPTTMLRKLLEVTRTCIAPVPKDGQ